MTGYGIFREDTERQARDTVSHQDGILTLGISIIPGIGHLHIVRGNDRHFQKSLCLNSPLKISTGKI